MTKKERARRKLRVARSDKAIDKLNSKPKRKSKQLDALVIRDIDLLRAYLDGQEMVYEEGINDGVRRYIFVNFDEEGYVIEPC